MYSPKDMRIAKRIFDNDAWTVADIVRETAIGESEARELGRERVAAGEWEQVWKRSPKNGRPVPAFRPSRPPKRP